jgi:hypothetical protein
MSLQERLERANWKPDSFSDYTITFKRENKYLILDWLNQEIDIVYGEGFKSYLPNEHEVELLCEKL